MSRISEYLELPEAYVAAIGGLRWSTGEEAVEFEDGSTFVFGRQIAPFLEGYASNGSLLPLAYSLHLILLFMRGRGRGPSLEGLSELFHATGRPLRNAGAFAAELCRGIELVELAPPPVEDVILRLTRGAVEIDLERFPAAPIATAEEGTEDDLSDESFIPISPEYWHGPPVPSLTPEEFESGVVAALGQFSADEQRHWLRFGRGSSPVGEDLAREIEPARPQPVGQAMAAALARPRLAGAPSLVDHLSGAISLPPRSFGDDQMPTGGYTDLSNRGALDRILPGQLALEPDEFLRRFAEGELLYYHREEPRAPESEELAVVLDQGVRTWGRVRLALVAGAVAMAKRAEKRGTRFRLWASSAAGRGIDPATTPAEELEAILETSDLTESPAETLSAALAEPCWGRRDIVVLGHPRGLADNGIATAMREIPAPTRLFTVGVDSEGRATFSEVRRGKQVALAEFRVALAAVEAEPPSRPRRIAGGWSGDVEPIGYPFRLPPRARERPTGLLEFDLAGEHLVAVRDLGMPVLITLDGSPAETLPRPWFEGRVCNSVRTILAVPGGFVLVTGGKREAPILARYDLKKREAWVLPTHQPDLADGEWFSVPAARLVVARLEEQVEAYRVGPERLEAIGRAEWTREEARAVEWVREQGCIPPLVSTLHESDTVPAQGPWVQLRRETGRLFLHGVGPDWRPFLPISDGHPRLRNQELTWAQHRAGTLALAIRDPASGERILMYRGRDLALPEITPTVGAQYQFRLGHDGNHLALVYLDRVEIRRADRAGEVVARERFSGTRGGQVAIGRDWLAIRPGSAHAHLLRWDTDRIVHVSAATATPDQFLAWLSNRPGLSPVIGTTPGGPLPAAVHYDLSRFEHACRGVELVAVTDRFGQVALLDAEGDVVAMFCARGGSLAAWAPDGTRYGTHDLLGQAPTPDADRRLARRLREATRTTTVEDWR